MISSVNRSNVLRLYEAWACSLPGWSRCRPWPFPTPHSGIAGSALQPSFEFCGKGGTPQDQSRVLPNERRGRPTGSNQGSERAGSSSCSYLAASEPERDLAVVGAAAGGHGPEGAEELVGDRDIGLPLLQSVVLALGEREEALTEVGMVEDQADGGLIGEQAQDLAAAAMDAAGGRGLAGAPLGGVAAGQLGQAAGVVEAAEIAGHGEQVDEHDVAQAANLAPQPAQAGALEGGQHAPVEDRDHPLGDLHALGGELDSQDG